MAATLDRIGQLELGPQASVHSPGDDRTEQLDAAFMRRRYAYMLKCRMVAESIATICRVGS